MRITEENWMQTNGKKSIVVLKKDEKALAHYLKFLSICGICINNGNVWSIYAVLMTLFIQLALAAFIYSIYFYRENLENLAVVIHHTMLAIDVQISTIYFVVTGSVVRRLLSGMCMSYNYGSQLVSDYLEVLEERRIKRMELTLKWTIVMMVYMQVNLIIFGAVDWYTRDDVEFMLLFPCWFPFDLSYLEYHVLAYLWEHILVEMIGFTIFGVISLIFLVCSHLTTQLSLLNFAIENTKVRAYELALGAQSRPQSNDACSESRLKECYVLASNMCAQHHIQIIEYYNEARGVFKVVYFNVFLTGLVVYTCTGVALISEYTSLKIKFLGVTFIQMVCFYVLCWFGEKIVDMSISVRLVVYGIEWYEMPRESQTTFKLIMERALRPLGFTSLIGQKADLDNFMTMIKASYSYFNMVLASQDVG